MVRVASSRGGLTLHVIIIFLGLFEIFRIAVNTFCDAGAKGTALGRFTGLENDRLALGGALDIERAIDAEERAAMV